MQSACRAVIRMSASVLLVLGDEGSAPVTRDPYSGLLLISSSIDGVGGAPECPHREPYVHIHVCLQQCIGACIVVPLGDKNTRGGGVWEGETHELIKRG